MLTDRPRPIIVDDTDPGIKYMGPWFQDQGSQNAVGNWGPVFNNTSHGSKSNASLSYAFNGTSIKVLGTNNIRNDSGVVDPSWECFVDEISIGAHNPYQFPLNNWVFCDVDQLVDGPHVLTVNATVARAQTFWFDQIQYVPSASVPLEQQTILVDSLDPELQFGPQWRNLADVANSTSTQGTQLVFNFTGIQLSWYGFIPTEFPHGPSLATYSIDGGTPINFLLRGLSQDSITIYNQKFFSTQTLSPGPHTLIVVHEGTGSTTPLTLDYLVVQIGTIPSTNGTSSTTNDTDPASNSTSSGGKGRSSIGLIVGGVVGGLALVIFAILGFLFLWRRERASTGDSRHTIEPFNYAIQIGPKLQVQQTAETSSGNGSSGKKRPGSMLNSRETGLSSIVATSSPIGHLQQPQQPHRLIASANANGIDPYMVYRPLRPDKAQRERGAALGAPAGPRLVSPPRDDSAPRLVLHEDSGIRMVSDGRRVNTVLEVPPVYAPA
ncbi:hypothetical protein B0H34DRAFT_672630 [Crassisporium funariophilum]|nr:hypothetical protein B0H34DRAFT_672630 [Crassisporium funariophilum]